MNNEELTAALPEELARCESRAIRDAMAGLTGNLGVEVCARVLDGQREAQHAEFFNTREAGELVAVGAA